MVISMIDIEYLINSAKKEGMSLDNVQAKQLDKYAELLVDWNTKINLTAIVEPNEIVIKHFIDSLLLLKYLKKNNTIKLIDVGTGAGFPSLPCLIADNRIDLTLLDSLNKRVNFLNEVTTTLGVKATAIHTRAEEAGALPEYREKFDIATARAVAHLRELSEYCLPFVKVGGCFIALKGHEIEDEANEAKAAIKQMGGLIEKIDKYELEDSSKRAIVIIKKISQTPTKYPRSFGKMKKQPIN